MELNLDGKVALVTGGSRGIGRGCALAFAEAGADVAVNYHSNEDAAQEVVDRMAAMGRKGLAIRADVSQPDDVEAMVQQALTEFGRIDILLANAATSTRQPFLETDRESLHRTIGVSMYGMFYSCQAVARAMVDRGIKGSIIVIGSAHGQYPLPLAIDYNMAKAAVHQMAMTVARELTVHRIRVNLLIPGWTDTPGERKWTTEDELQEAAKHLPWGRLGTPADVGNVAVFLASDAAEYVSGSEYTVDGALGVSMPSGGSSKERARE